ncbi:hypothetical protein NUM3379_27900 [Kineococcus sp. NUM-3379]
MADREALLQVLAAFARRAGGTFHVPDILGDLAVAAGRVLEVQGAGVAIRYGPRVEFVRASNPVAEQIGRVQDALQQGPCLDVRAGAGPVVVEDLAACAGRWPVFVEQAVALGLHAAVSLPLQARGRVWGSLDVYRAEPGPFVPADLETAQVLADVACSYLVMAHDRDEAVARQREASHAATHDPLTGLANRALLHDRLHHALDTSRRHGTPLAVLFLDLDGFKAVNDTYGHEVGDALLVEVARRLRDALRAGDTLARLGGDEFVVVCENLHRDPVGGVAEDSLAAVVARVRAALRRRVRVQNHDIAVAASLGVATSTGSTEDTDALLRAADAAMYEAKRRRASRQPSAGAPGGVYTVVDLAAHEERRRSANGSRRGPARPGA